MALAGKTVASFQQGGGAAVKIKVPSTYHAGDLLVVAESANVANTSWSAPAGWTSGGGGQLDGQDLHWWWKVASPNEPNRYLFSHSQWADGGMMMLDFAGTSATPILGASALGAFDNLGAGHVSQAACGAVVSVNATSLLLIGWQPSSSIPSWPGPYTPLASATDGYGHVAAAANWTTSSVSLETVSMNPAQAVVLTMQVAIG